MSAIGTHQLMDVSLVLSGRELFCKLFFVKWFSNCTLTSLVKWNYVSFLRA